MCCSMLLILSLDAKTMQLSKKSVDWKQEYRITAFYNDKIINNQLKHDTRPLTNVEMPEISKNHFKYVLTQPDVQPSLEFFVSSVIMKLRR